MLDALDPLSQHHARVRIRARVGNHADAHAVKAAAVAAGGDDVDDLVVGHRRPVDADEVAVGVVALGFAMTCQAAIGAVGAAAFWIGEQQVQAARAGGAMHVAAHHSERDRRGRRHLHVFRRAHVGREEIVVRAIDAVRRHVLRLHPAAVARLGRHRRRHARLHGLGIVEGAPLLAEKIRNRTAGHFQTAHSTSLSVPLTFMPPSNAATRSSRRSARARRVGRRPHSAQAARDDDAARGQSQHRKCR